MEQIRSYQNALSILAPAKINLSLLVAGKRPDGFHELETLMAKVDWYDEITIEPGRKAGVELICEGPCWAPEGADNLVHQAAALLLGNVHLDVDVRITLRKNIPAGTGLGSASSDAAATLMGLNHYLELNLNERQLLAFAAQLGSDVSFFLNGPLAFCTGRGEKISKLNEIFRFLALVILPDVSVSTKTVYENYEHDPALYRKLNAKIKLYMKEKKIDFVVNLRANMLQESCYKLETSLAELRETVESLGIGPCCLSGSGSAMFCILESGKEQEAIEYRQRVEKKTGCGSAIVRNNEW